MRRKRLLWILLGLAGVLLLSGEAFSLFLRARTVHRYLVVRLEAAFGRPVEVGHFDFSVLDGFRFGASPITIAEDPRYGYEYFLRAERMTAGLRWRSLLRGGFELGTLSFTRPSLNLVRASDGHWNLESWLPPITRAGRPPAQIVGPLPTSPLRPGRLYRIEIDGGRVNFKHGDDKSPFALVDVRGLIEQETSARWRVDLEARPLRATVSLQEAGTVRVQGRVGGTSARLQPAELALTWQKASLADALRLARGRDYGVRGSLSAELTARIAAPSALAGQKSEAAQAQAVSSSWQLRGAARLAGVHRWDLPQRPDNPSVNLLADMDWQRGSGRMEFTRCVLEAPHSSVRGLGSIEWSPTFVPEFHLLGSGIDFGDLLSWYRAFHPGVAEDLRVDGILGLDVTLGGWPLRLEQGMVESPSGRVDAETLPVRARLGALKARAKSGRLELQPVTLSFASSASSGATAHLPPASGVRLEGFLGSGPASAVGSSGQAAARGGAQWPFALSVEGPIDRVQDVLATARAFGRTVNVGWTADGQATLRLRAQGALYPFAAESSGEIQLSSVRLQAPYLNQPILLEKAKLEFKPGERSATLSAARAFSAQWKGTLRKSAGAPWSFDLKVDRLDVADLDRWLGPRARPGLLERLFPFMASKRPSPEFESAVGTLRAEGRLQADQFVVGPLQAERLRGMLRIEGRAIELRDAEGEFYKGGVRGRMLASLTAEPTYEFQLQWDRVDLDALTSASAPLKGRFSGIASGEGSFVTHGIGRAELARALEGSGSLHVRGAQFHGIDLEASYARAAPHAGTSRFAIVQSQFRFDTGHIQLERTQLTNAASDFELQGTADFARVLDLRLWKSSLSRPGKEPAAGAKILLITGPLTDLRIRPGTPGAPPK